MLFFFLLIFKFLGAKSKYFLWTRIALGLSIMTDTKYMFTWAEKKKDLGWYGGVVAEDTTGEANISYGRRVQSSSTLIDLGKQY